jgi:hypothetical protein
MTPWDRVKRHRQNLLLWIFTWKKLAYMTQESDVAPGPFIIIIIIIIIIINVLLSLLLLLLLL